MSSFSYLKLRFKIKALGEFLLDYSNLSWRVKKGKPEGRVANKFWSEDQEWNKK